MLVAKNRLPMQETQETRIQSMGWEDPLEEGTATHSSTLAWRISWTEEHGGLLSTGCKESGTTERLHFHFHSLEETLILGKTEGWRRKWQPLLVFLPGESHGQRSLVGYSPWGCKEEHMTE